MADEQQLRNIGRVMDHKTRQLQQKVSAAQSEVLALENQKQLITGAQNSNALECGYSVNALSCWNRNEFSSLISEVLLLLDQKLTEQQQNLGQLQTSLEHQEQKARGVERLADKKALEAREIFIRRNKLESEEILHRI